MAYIAVNSTGNFVALKINASGTDYDSNVSNAFVSAANADIMTVPALQEVTLNASPGTFRWQQLDNPSELVVTTPATNSVAVTLVMDDTTFFGNVGATPALVDIVNNKTKVYFRLGWQGLTNGDRYIQGKGYLTALAPTVSPGSPVWTTPITIEVDGEYTRGNVA
jgi:hypothetical protein